MNICKGDRVVWDAPQFSGGSFYNGRSTGRIRRTGTSRYSGVVIKESYGATTNQHTFTILLDTGKKKLVKGRNLYPNIVTYTEGPEHDAAALEKANRKMGFTNV